jgi:hypothetical protein
MERVWRNFPPAQISIGQILGQVLVFALASYAVLHPYLPANWPAHEFLKEHISSPVSAILIGTLLALFTPPGMVLRLRNAGFYRGFVRGTKLFGLPFFFAVSFYGLALLFGSHFAFSLEDSFGMVCPTSPNIEQASDDDKPNQGLESCPAAVVASCHTGTPTCPDGRVVSCAEAEGSPSCKGRTRPAPGCNPLARNCNYNVPVCEVSIPAKPPNQLATTQTSGFAICPSTCEIRPNAVDRVTKNIDNNLNVNSVCKATGIWLEQGQKYRIRITAPPPDAKAPWKDGHIKVSTRGMDVSELSLLDRFWQVVQWPLKRNLFVEPFKVIARVGSTGSDERVLEPGESPKSNNLEAVITPKRDGELFLYVNEAVWAYKPAWGNFYRDNTGTATIAVQRADD